MFKLLIMSTIKTIRKRTTTKNVRSRIKRETGVAPLTAIKDKPTYEKIMAEIERLMAKGSESVTPGELAKIRELALAAQAYEKNAFVIPAPTTLAGIIEMRMYEMRLKQKDLAQKLHISNTKLSLILNGKQKPDVAFLKAVHSELNIDANVLLKMAV